jgi:hypothetical protein
MIEPEKQEDEFADLGGESSAQVTQPEMQPAESINIEELTITELIGQFFRAPGITFQALNMVLTAPVASNTQATVRINAAAASMTKAESQPVEGRWRDRLVLALRGIALLLALRATTVMATVRTEQEGLLPMLPLVVVAILVWIGSEVVVWYGERLSLLKQLDSSDVPTQSDLDSETDWLMRAAYVLGATLLSVVCFTFVGGNQWTLVGVAAWIASVVLWIAAFAPASWGVRAAVGALRQIQLPDRRTLLALIVIMVVATFFRLYELGTVPSEMTSDHVEKILDAQRILNGQTQVFFPNNGGREPFHFYMMAAFSQLPGLGMNFFTLKLLTVLEGLISIPLLWWLGRALIGQDEPQLGNTVGLMMAALVATSYWHQILSRLGLRIMLTVIATSLVLIFLSRALRYNRRGDFIMTGFFLGIGIYMYQAVRMLPVVVICGVVIAGLFALFAHSRREKLIRYGLHLLILVMVSFAVFIPLFRFSLDSPEDFWRRTSGRLLGDVIIETTDSQGNIIQREATIEERAEAFQTNITTLVGNIRNALLTYNWKGDVAWVTAAPNEPTMDVWSGALLILGIGAWTVRMLQRRDSVNWLMPIAAFLLLLPSALSIAYPIENPSHTRMSGTLPIVYLWSALPLTLLIVSLRRVLGARTGNILGVALAAAIIGLSFRANWMTYFVGTASSQQSYAQAYNARSWGPYREAGDFLRGFAESNGSLGNAFMFGFVNWWDHRAVGIEAGVTDWPNGVVNLDDLPRLLNNGLVRMDQYTLDPEKPLLFFYSIEDVAAEERFLQWFPQGYSQVIRTAKPERGEYKIYFVPPLGYSGMQEFLVLQGVVG